MSNNLTREEVVYIAEGMIEAESIKILLESFGLKAFTNQESAGIAMGFTIGALGQVEVLVPKDQVLEAKRIIKEMENGKLDLDNIDEENHPDDSESD